MEKGILLLSLGNDLYTRYAFNLALSIKHTSPDVHITLVHNNNLYKLTEKQLYERKVEAMNAKQKYENRVKDLALEIS